jgi:hypothetical protein
VIDAESRTPSVCNETFLAAGVRPDEKIDTAA